MAEGWGPLSTKVLFQCLWMIEEGRRPSITYCTWDLIDIWLAAAGECMGKGEVLGGKRGCVGGLRGEAARGGTHGKQARWG